MFAPIALYFKCRDCDGTWESVCYVDFRDKGESDFENYCPHCNAPAGELDIEMTVRNLCQVVSERLALIKDSQS